MPMAAAVFVTVFGRTRKSAADYSPSCGILSPDFLRPLGDGGPQASAAIRGGIAEHLRDEASGEDFAPHAKIPAVDRSSAVVITRHARESEGYIVCLRTH